MVEIIDGVTLREHLQAVETATGVRPDEINGPPLPIAGAYLWGWFLELHGERQSSGYGPQPITSTQIRDWSLLTGAEPDPWDVTVLKTLDQTFRTVAAEQADKQAKSTAAGVT